MSETKARVNRFTDDEFRQLVARCTSIRQMILEGGWKEAGGTYAMLHKRIRRLGLDITHFKGRGWNLGGVAKNRRAVEDYLKENCFSIPVLA